MTVAFELSGKVQLPVPLQVPPLQPVNTEPAAGIAVHVTLVPDA